MPAALETFIAEPLRFGESVLGRKRWARQEEIRRAVWEHRRVHIRSANSVGKTFELGSLIVEWLCSRRRRRVICGGPSHDTIKRGLWSEVRRAYFGALARGHDLGGVMGKKDWILGDAWDAAIVSVDNISNAQGARGTETLIVIDEAQGVQDPELWTAFESLMTDPGSRMVQSGNPLWPQGTFHEAFRSPEWHTIRINGMEHPNVISGEQLIPGSISRIWIEEKREAWGEDDPKFVARVLGEFPEEGDCQLVSAKMLEDCATITPAVTVKKAAGLDVARFGGDQNVAVILDEHRKVIHVEHWRGMDLMETAGRYVSICRKFEIAPGWACVDVCGIGAGVVDRCKEAKLQVLAVDFGAGASGRWRQLLGREALHLNRKAELHDLARYYFKHRLISVPNVPANRPIWADLTALTYTFDGSGNMKVESKEKIRDTIGRSPDYSDALVIALAATGYVPLVG